jgi:G3E family GTPase
MKNMGRCVIAGTSSPRHRQSERIGALSKTCWRQGNDMLRYKGVLAIEGKAERLIFQGAPNNRFRLWPPLGPDDTHRRASSVIGRRLDGDAIKAGFEAACR